MANQEVLLLFLTDAWHTRDSHRLIACFSSWNDVVVFLDGNKKTYPIAYNDLVHLKEVHQTQGLENNYLILTERLNPLKA